MTLVTGSFLQPTSKDTIYLFYSATRLRMPQRACDEIKVLGSISLTKHRSLIRSLSKPMKGRKHGHANQAIALKPTDFPFIGSHTKRLIQLWYLGCKNDSMVESEKITRHTELSFVVGPYKNYLFENNTIQRPLRGWNLTKC